MRRLLLALVTALTLLGLSGSALAANGDNLRLITADSSGTACADSAPGFKVGVGLAFDGTNLLISCWNDSTISVIRPTDGSQVTHYSVIGGSSLGALAWDEGRHVIWACNASSTVGTIDPATHVFTAKFATPGCFDGLAYDGSDDSLWTSPDATNSITHSTSAGVPLATFTPPLPCGDSGIAVGGPLLYLATDGCSSIYTSDKAFLSAPVLFAGFPARLEDLECDNLTFSGKGAMWSKDAYDNFLNAWEIPKDSCIFGGGAKALTLTPATAENPAGTDHTVTAHLTDRNGPVAGAHILFSVTGANPQPQTDVLTNASGDATFTYHGLHSGDDVIKACYDANSNGVCDADEATATATKHWKIGPPATLTLSPKTATNTAGVEHCVYATVKDADGNLIPLTPVDFSVAGPNGPITGTATTGPSGEPAKFCYTGTHAGTDTITATATDPLGTKPSDTATKTYTAGTPAKVTLTPATATNPVDTKHCLTANVVDAFGNPVAGVTVLFSVTGANPAGGSAVTDASGNATFCYLGLMTGADTITATADVNGNGKADAGEPGAVASKTWTLPAPGLCGEVDAEGYIATVGGKGIFKLDAQYGVGHPSPGGHVKYKDTGPASQKAVSVTIDAVIIVDSSHAEIFGTAKVNGGAPQSFRVDVSHTAAGDTFSIMWAGYAAGGPLVKGEVEIDVEPCETDDHNHDGNGDGKGGKDNNGGGDKSAKDDSSKHGGPCKGND